MVMVVIAVFIRPLPILVAGTLTWVGYLLNYLLNYLLPLIGVGGVAWLLGDFAQRRQSARALRNALGRVLSLARLFGPIQVRRNVRDSFDNPAPIPDALPMALSTLRVLTPGASFTQAVSELSFPGDTHACALIASGEASGAFKPLLPQDLR